MALLDGNAIFGLGVKCPPPTINDRRDQKAMYPGLNGTESLDMGDQGAFTEVSGRLYGINAGAFQLAVVQLLSYFDGAAHTLLDNQGFTWPNVKMVSIAWEGEGTLDPTYGYSRRYTCRFFHLTLL